mgnify:CR=1 FL=1
MEEKGAPEPNYTGIQYLTGDEYFALLNEVDKKYMKVNFPRLSALLQNLVERRDNKWQKHLSAADGPKKLKEIQDDIEGAEMGNKAQSNVNKDK